MFIIRYQCLIPRPVEVEPYQPIYMNHIFLLGEKRVRVQQLRNEIRKARTLNGRYAIEVQNKKQSLNKQLAALEMSKDQKTAEIRKLGYRRKNLEDSMEDKKKEKDRIHPLKKKTNIKNIKIKNQVKGNFLKTLDGKKDSGQIGEREAI